MKLMLIAACKHKNEFCAALGSWRNEQAPSESNKARKNKFPYSINHSKKQQKF